ncbi:MAG: translocation/assembly module TamB [Endomicrobium sp.]|jgi:hypothetical protein|nr:translocation/assembly module TamB [Endomicrobium sp.]
MVKALRYFFYFLILSALIFAVYNIRTAVIVPYIAKYVSEVSGHNIKIKNFYLSPLKCAVVVSDISFDDYISAERIAVYIRPIDAVKNLKNPAGYIKLVEIPSIEINLDKKIKKQETQEAPKKEKKDFKFPFLNAGVIINSVLFKADGIDFKAENTEIRFDGDKMSAAVCLEIFKNRFFFNSRVLQKQDNILNADYVIFSSDFLTSFLRGKVEYDLASSNFLQNAFAKKLAFGKFDFSGSSASFSKNENGASFELSGKFGKISASYSDLKDFILSAQADLFKINKDTKGELSVRISSAKNLDAYMKAENLIFFGLNLGSLNAQAARAKNGGIEANCVYDEKNGGRISASVSRNGIYTCVLHLGSKTAGALSGNFKTGEFSVELPETDVSKMPFAQAFGENPAGTLEASGNIDDYSGKIKFSLKNFKTKNIGKTDVSGLFARQGALYVVNFYKSDNSIIFNAVTENMRLLSSDFKFTEIESSSVLRIFGLKGDLLSGISSGRIIYEKDANAEFDVRIYDGKIKGASFMKFEVKGDITDERVNIKNLIYKTGKETNLYAYGLIGFTKDNPRSYFNIRTRNLGVSGFRLNGDLSFNGGLDSKGSVVGKFESADFKVSNVSFKKLSGDALITQKSFAISSLRAENGLDAQFYSDFSGKFNGLLNLKNTNIKNAVEGLSGALSLSVKFSGGLRQIKASAEVSLKKASYLKIPFSLSLKAFLSDGVLTLSESSLISDKTKISSSGKIGGTEKLKIDVENVTENIINKFVGFRTPLKGGFSGSGEFGVVGGKPTLNMALNAPEAYVKNVKLKSLKANIAISDAKIKIDGASAKIADSEIRADSGSFDVKSGKYDLNMFLVNAHLGPADMFGRIEMSGVMDKKKGGSVYSGNLNISNFWINRYKLSSYDLDYEIKNKKVFISREKSNDGGCKISGLIDLSDSFLIKDLNISQRESSLNLTAGLKNGFINLEAKGQFLDGAFLTEILDLPVDVEGNASLRIKCGGNLSSPEAEFILNILDGNVEGIPYDNIDAEISASQNEGSAKISMRKKNEINMSINGTFPFWLDSSLAKVMKKKTVSFEYEIEDNKLNLIKHFSGDFFKPRGGKLSFKGKISGTFAKIRNSGKLTVSGGSFDSKHYFERIKDFNADISIRDNFITIDKFSAKTKPGRIYASGSIKLDNFKPSYFDLRFYTDNKGAALSVPLLPITSFFVAKNILNDVSKGEPKFDIYVRGEPSKPKITGQVILENTRFSFPPPKGDTNFPLPEDTEFDIELMTGKNTKYENAYINAWINGNLNIRGKLGKIKAPGVIDTQRGTINYLGINFEIISAKLEVTDNNQVFLSGEAETSAYSKTDSEPDTIRMVISKSELNALNVRFYSKDDPSMDSQKALAKATKTEQGAEGDSSQLIGFSDFALRQQALRLIDSSIATPLARTVLRKTGLVDNFKVTYIPFSEQTSQPSSEESSFVSLLSGTRYSVEKNLTNQLLLGYSITFDQIEKVLDLRHAIEMRYKLSNNFYLSGSYELESERAVHQPDRKLMLQHQFRFGLPSGKKDKEEK